MSNNGYTGISFPTVLFVVFLVLKLTGVIAWSWWWVTAPLWIPAAFAIVILGFVAFFLVAAILLKLF